MELSYIYDVTYTKAAFIHTKKGYVARCIGSACIITAIIYFVALNKKDFHKVDIAITYTLLIGAIVLDGAAHVMLLLSDWTRVYIEESNVTPCTEGHFLSLWKRWGEMNILTRMKRKQRWGETMSQLNLISYCLDNPVPREGWIHRICCCVFQMKPLFHFFKKAAEKLCCTEMLDQTIYVTRKPVNDEIKDFIFNRLRIESKKAETFNTEKIKEVCKRRGLGALEKIKNSIKEKEMFDPVSREEVTERNVDEEYQRKQKSEEIVKASIETHDFDHSLLLWHIATELCCYSYRTENNPTTDDQVSLTEHWKRMGKLLSDYMLYLLVMQPSMLMTTAGIGLLRFRDTCAEARRFFEQGGWDVSQDDACKMLKSVNTSTNPAEVKGDRSKSVLFDACILAKCLLTLEKDTRWWLIAEVWAEMLFYTASHCRGYGHVRQLSKGGEMLTIVWLLMAHLGLGEMYQIQGGQANAKLIAEK